MSLAVPSATPTSSIAPTAPAEEPAGFCAAFEQTAAARAALAPGDLLRINLDIPSVVATVLGALPKLRALREDIQKRFVGFDLAQFDAIERYACALSYAHAAVLAASAPTEDLPALARRAIQLRELLTSDASALVRRGLLEGKRLSDLKRRPGYLAIAYDLGVLVRVLRARWSDIASKSAIQPSDLDEADRLYERLSHAHGARSRASENITSAADDRVRAFTLLVRAYDQARRAAVFVRWEEEDADDLVPSLWAGRGGRRATKAKPGESRVDPLTEAVASPAPAAHSDGSLSLGELKPTVAADGRPHVEERTAGEAYTPLESIDELLRRKRAREPCSAILEDR